MKKTPINSIALAIIASCVLFLFAGYSSILARSGESNCVNHGDVNLDGTITAADAQLAFFIVLGTYSPTFEEECAADCNGDGEVTAADAQAIFLVVLGLGDCADPLATPTPTIPTGYVLISPGSYWRGSPGYEPCRSSNEGPQHQVTLTGGFYMMTTEVTRQMWADLQATQPTLPDDPSNTAMSPTMEHPVQRVTWYEAVLFANLMSLQDGLIPCYYTNATFTVAVDASNYTTGPFFCNFGANGYRLPTEAEWEYAARAGTTGPFSAHEPDYSSDNCHSCSPDPPLNVLDSIAWWCGNSGEVPTAHPVGAKLPNPWGLYDMHGNVWEFCWDWFGDYPSEPVTDPTGPLAGSTRVRRGGSYAMSATYSRSARREDSGPGDRNSRFGFRLLRSTD